MVLTVDKDEVVQRLLKRAQDEGRADDTEDVIRHRQEVYAEQTAPLIEVYAERGLLVEVDGMGAVDEVTARVFDALERDQRRQRLSASLTVFRDRGVEIKTPDQIEPMRAAGLVVGETLDAAARRSTRAGMTTGELDADRRGEHPRRRGDAVVPGLRPPAVPGDASASRSTTRSCTASPATGWSHDGDIVSIDCGAIVDGWHGDAARDGRGGRGRPPRRSS